MQTTTKVEVNCDCRIPFQFELVKYLEQLFSTAEPDGSDLKKLKQISSRVSALQTKMVFIKVTNPTKKHRQKFLTVVKQLFNKDLVGTIRSSKNEVTLILI